MKFSDILKDYPPYKRVLDGISQTPASIAGITESAQAHLIYSLCADTGKSALAVTYSDNDARALKNELAFYFDNVFHFPERDYIFYNIDSTDRSRLNERISVLSKLGDTKSVNGDTKINIVTASLDSLMQYTADKAVFSEYTIEFKSGGRYDIAKITAKLAVMGYVREDMVEGAGQFSVRGEILDIFSPNYDAPLRIDFFDDEVETIKSFDPLTQRSMGTLKSANICPVTEVILTPEKKAAIISRLTAALCKAEKSGADKSELIKTLTADIESFNERYYFPSIDKYAGEINGKIPSLLDWFDNGDLIFIIDPKRLCERGRAFDNEKAALVTELMERGMICGADERHFMPYYDALDKINARHVICLDPLTHTKNDFQYRTIETFTTKTTVSFHGKIEYLYDDLKRYAEKRAAVVILASTRGRGENIAGTLKDKGFNARFSSEGAGDTKFYPGEITVIHGSQSKGFEYPELNFVLISDNEIFDSRRRKKTGRNADRLKSYNDISPGDYVVHEAHGIGRYMGLHKMTVKGVTKDYLKIQYRGTDVLYVPVDQLDVLYKYSGSTDRQLKLNKLGGKEWNNTKQRVKASTAELAAQLVKLYAAREHIKGFAYSADGPWQREFEDEFEYRETSDQLRAIDEVKADMEKPRPMDRLLCGDVGFGKTEVALRAAFKAVGDSKQVAYFCPTTVLALQHYETFLKRMANFPIKVEMLSRFRTAAEIKRILKQLKTGEIDIIIGTHRLLSGDVAFKDLGLLIIDEEQRFGVAHKERLKELKNSVDVLTMTATPIPRTLHMAMTSVRDMSVLTEPPENRYPVQTFVLEENESVILDAIRNELSRGGQVFYLFNSVAEIYHKARYIQSQFPSARVAAGHGKMREDELEDIMCDMSEGRIDVLVCTTIIETGLDIPNANTIIIENADRMGLAQLYQLRGRVGRSNRAAYAYLMYKRDKVLTEIASKRLRAIREFTEFGSGFKIAMRDLEIRGAGNLLGPEQHGHMDTVGYDMYCKLLRESINEARDITAPGDVNVTIDIEADAYLPDSYIPNQNQRIDMYKRIAAIASEDDKYEIEEELEDRYGKLPKSVINIISVAMMKCVARGAGICEITQHDALLQLKFGENELDATLIWDIDGMFPKRIRVASAAQPTINFRIMPEDGDIITLINKILNAIDGLKNPEK